jgi:hypothetical protein
VDLDLANAASVRQALTGPINEISWLKAPRAQASQWLQEIRSYMNARLQRRSGIDHMGFSSGKVVRWSEDWSDVGFVTHGTNSNGTWARRWNYGNGGSGSIGSVSVHAPGFTGPYRGMAVAVAASSPAGANYSVVQGKTGEVITSDDIEHSLQWDASFVSSPSAGHDYDFAMGWVDGAASLLGTGTTLSFSPSGVFFLRRSGDANWQCVYQDQSVNLFIFDSGVAIAANGARFRIEVRGANACDDSQAHLIWIINGAIVKNVTLTNLASGLGNFTLAPFFRGRGFVNAQTLSISPMDFCGNMWPGNVFI